MLKFGQTEPPRLSNSQFGATEVDEFIKYIHRMIQVDTFVDSVMEVLIDNESKNLLCHLFKTTEAARDHPTPHHWTVDWDVTTIIAALEEISPRDPPRAWTAVRRDGTQVKG